MAAAAIIVARSTRRVHMVRLLQKVQPSSYRPALARRHRPIPDAASESAGERGRTEGDYLLGLDEPGAPLADGDELDEAPPDVLSRHSTGISALER